MNQIFVQQIEESRSHYVLLWQIFFARLKRDIKLCIAYCFDWY